MSIPRGLARVETVGRCIRSAQRLRPLALLTCAVNLETPVFGNWTFHELGLWLAAGFAIFASTIALVLITLHATHYSKPWEQKQYAQRPREMRS